MLAVGLSQISSSGVRERRLAPRMVGIILALKVRAHY